MVLSEILTLLIGFLLSLVIVDGIRRLIKRRKNNLKFASAFVELEKDKQIEGLVESVERESEDNVNLDIDLTEVTSEQEVKNRKLTNGLLLIIYIKTQSKDPLSLALIKNELETKGMSYNQKGFFYFNNLNQEQVNFSLLNGINPGIFNDETRTSLVSLVLDTQNNNNPVEALEKMLELANWFSKSFNADLLDESRNMLTKQMIDHMRQKAQEDQRQYLTSGSH